MKLTLALAAALLLAPTLMAQRSVSRTGTANEVCANASGDHNALTCNLNGAASEIASYTNGGEYKIRATGANTGSVSVNFNAVGVTPIRKVIGGVTTELAPGDICSGLQLLMMYDSTNTQFQVKSTLCQSYITEYLYMPASLRGGVPGNAASYWTTPTSGGATHSNNQNPPRGILVFADGTDSAAVTHLLLPPTYVSSVATGLTLHWASSGTNGGNAVMTLETGCVATTESYNVTFNTAQSITITAPGATNTAVFSTFSAVTMTGCAANELLFLRLTRDADNGSDTLTDDLYLTGTTFTYTRKAV